MLMTGGAGVKRAYAVESLPMDRGVERGVGGGDSSWKQRESEVVGAAGRF